MNEEIMKDLNFVLTESVGNEEIKEKLESVIAQVLDNRIYNNTVFEYNYYPVVSNILRTIIKKKKYLTNFILSIIIKYTQNDVGLYLIGMLIRNGANPNVYYSVQGYGNLHILCVSTFRTEYWNYLEIDPYLIKILRLLKMLGSDDSMPAYQYKDYNMQNLDTSFITDVVNRETQEGKLTNEGPVSLTVKDFVLSKAGVTLSQNDFEWLNEQDMDTVQTLMISVDKVSIFREFVNSDYIEDIDSNENNTIKFMYKISTAGSLNIAGEIKENNLQYINSIINGQPLALFVATNACDHELFNLFIKKGSPIKYATINNIVVYFKYLGTRNLKLSHNNFIMLLDAINIGADIDLYQFEMFSSTAKYEESEDIKKAFQIPRWKKLCNLELKESRVEIKQLAFNLNLDYSMTEEQICNKLKHISLLDREDYLGSVIKRQEERINTKLMNSYDYINQPKGGNNRLRCSEKCTIINNPYLYNDARMSFYKDPKTGEIWCFTSDTFQNLITSNINPYTGDNLPVSFIETIKSQINILKELSVFENNESIKDTLKSYFDRESINNKKIDFRYNTVVKCLSLFDVSEEYLNQLSSFTLEDTILANICNISVEHFDLMTPLHKLKFTTSMIYTLYKNNPEEYENIFQRIGESLGKYEEIPIEDGEMVPQNLSISEAVI